MTHALGDDVLDREVTTAAVDMMLEHALNHGSLVVLLVINEGCSHLCRCVVDMSTDEL